MTSTNQIDTQKITNYELTKLILRNGPRLAYDSICKKFSEHPILTTAKAISYAAMLTAVPYFVITKGNEEHAAASAYSKAYSNALVHVDVNRDNVATSEEWGAAYKRIGVFYDSQNPAHLSKQQLESIVSAFK